MSDQDTSGEQRVYKYLCTYCNRVEIYAKEQEYTVTCGGCRVNDGEEREMVEYSERPQEDAEDDVVSSRGEIARVKQKTHEDCVAACVATLTDHDLDDLLDEYDMPMDTSDAIELLSDEYEHVFYKHFTGTDVLLTLPYLVEDFIFFIESPSRERDPEMYFGNLQADRQDKFEYVQESYTAPTWQDYERYVERAGVNHAIAVHKGRLYDPQEPPYWPCLGSISGDGGYENDYELDGAIICTNDVALEPSDGLPIEPAGYSARDEWEEAQRIALDDV